MPSEKPIGMSPKLFAALAAVVSTISSSLAWVSEREAVLSLGALATSCYSSILGGCIILAIGRAQGTLRGIADLKEHARDFAMLLGTRYLSGGLVLTYALTLTTSSKVMFLTKMEPYVVVLWFWFINGDRLNPKQLRLLTVHIVGALLLSTGGTFSFGLETAGDLLIAIGIILNSISYAPAQRLARAVGPATASGLPSLVAGLLLLPFTLLISPEALSWNQNTAHGWVYLGITVILFYALSLLAWFYSLRGLDAWMSSALRCIGPVVAAPVAWIFFGQELSLIQSFGAAVVLLTSLMMVFERSKK